MTQTGDTTPPDPSRKFATVGEALDDLAERTRFDPDDLAAVAPDPPAAPGPVPTELGEDPAVVSVLTNAIGFELFHADGRPREVDGENVRIETTDEETARARSAAVRVLRELRGMGKLAPAVVVSAPPVG